jgi:hypothetical protein
MKTNTLIALLRLAGVAHLGILAAGASMPSVVNLRSHIAVLPQFIRQLFWVYYSFIGLCLVSFGAITFFFAERLVDGSSLSRAVCVFLTAFWTLRLAAATLVFDVRPYLTSAKWRIGYHATSIVFILLPLIYLAAAWRGGAP